jgi:hypothetical protein
MNIWALSKDPESAVQYPDEYMEKIKKIEFN